MRKRSQVAWRLLQTSQLSIEEIAFRVGFAQRTLLRQLRRWTGHSPAQLRRSLTLATSVGAIASSVQPTS
jgi:transcriptional regulator GlxA family with amidase domain